jgi:hypothetical protein
MPITLERGITGASSRTSSSITRRPVAETFVYSGSPAITAMLSPSTRP